MSFIYIWKEHALKKPPNMSDSLLSHYLGQTFNGCYRTRITRVIKEKYFIVSCVFVYFIEGFSLAECELLSLLSPNTISFSPNTALGTGNRTDTKPPSSWCLYFSKHMIYLQNSLSRYLGFVWLFFVLVVNLVFSQ